MFPTQICGLFFIQTLCSILPNVSGIFKVQSPLHSSVRNIFRSNKYFASYAGVTLEMSSERYARFM
jgi:hypothetical protein